MIIRLGAIVSKAAGSLGGITFSNRSGVSMCSLRPRRTNKQTESQLQLQNAQSQAGSAWRALSDAQRLGWNLFAYRNIRVNRVGVARRISGYAFYLQQATIRINAGLAPPTTVPNYGQQGVGTPAGVNFTAGGPYAVYWYSPTTDPHGAFILSGHRPCSTHTSKKPFWHVFPAYAVEHYVEMDLQPAWDAAMGPLAAGERFTMRIRYAGDRSLVSAYTTYTAIAT
jgi:hypothetical protein